MKFKPVIIKYNIWEKSSGDFCWKWAPTSEAHSNDVNQIHLAPKSTGKAPGFPVIFNQFVVSPIHSKLGTF